MTPVLTPDLWRREFAISLQPLVWDGSNPLGNPVTYTAGSSSSSPVGGQGSEPGWFSMQAGTLNPGPIAAGANTGRIRTVAALGTRSGYCSKLVCYDTDWQSVVPVGGASQPSAAMLGPRLINPTGLSDVYISGSIWFPGTNGRGDNPFPIIPYGSTLGTDGVSRGNFYQFMELYGPPYTFSPPWSLMVISPSGSGGPNYAIMPLVLSPGYPYGWQDSAQLQYECWNDWVAHVKFAQTATTDGTAATGGLVEFWWGPGNTGAFGSTLIQQTFRSSPTRAVTGDTSVGSTSVANLSAQLTIGAQHPISGPGIQAGTILTVTGPANGQTNNTGTLSLPAVSGAGTGSSLTITYYQLFNSGKTLGMVTATPCIWNGSVAGDQVYYNSYRTRNMVTGASDPVTVYHGHQQIGTTYASVTSP